MATVPNWIAKGYAYNPGYGLLGPELYKITSWRATNTQVIVELEGRHGEHRFRLGDLVYAYRRDEHRRRMVLIPPEDERVAKAKGRQICSRAVSELRDVIDATRLDASAMHAEDLFLEIGRIQRAATKAMADLADLL